MLITRVLHVMSCCCYHKGTYFQANHNDEQYPPQRFSLLLLPQRYVFSSKSQPGVVCGVFTRGCCCYHKGTYFQANHNTQSCEAYTYKVVVATTKVRIFKQITTRTLRYQLYFSCCCYHKGTYFQANHNK